MDRVGADFVRERDAFRATLAEVGPDAPTACGAWTTTDLALHFCLGEVARAVPNTPFRALVRAGVRLDRMAGWSARALRGSRTRHDFDWALRWLERPAPMLHRTRAIAPVSLLEVWAHHEDILAVNDVRPCESGVDLAPVARVLVRYQRRHLAAHAVRVTSPGTVWFAPAGDARADVSGAVDGVARWLAGRARVESLTVSGDAPLGLHL